MREPADTDPAPARAPRRRALVPAFLVVAIAAGAGLGLGVTLITRPAARTEPSASASTLVQRASRSAEASSVATSATSWSPEPSASASPIPAEATSGVGDFSDLRVELHDIDPASTVGTIWDVDLAESVARQLGADVASLRVHRVETLTADPLPPEWMAITVTYGEGSPVDAVGGYLAERIRRPSTRLASSTINEGDRMFVVSEDWALGWADHTLFLASSDMTPYHEATTEERKAMPDLRLLIATVADVLLGDAVEARPMPSASPWPSGSPAPTAPADLGLEATLPTSILGHPQRVTSFAWLTPEQVYSLAGGLNSWLVPHFGREPADASMAFAGGTVSSFGIIAHRLRGISGDQLLGAFLGERFAGPAAGWEQLWEAREVDGRRYVVNESAQALYVQDDILYWLMYFDFGDCWDECDREDRPPFEEIAREAIKSIPESPPSPSP